MDTPYGWLRVCFRPIGHGAQLAHRLQGRLCLGEYYHAIEFGGAVWRGEDVRVDGREGGPSIWERISGQLKRIWINAGLSFARKVEGGERMKVALSVLV